MQPISPRFAPNLPHGQTAEEALGARGPRWTFQTL